LPLKLPPLCSHLPPQRFCGCAPCPRRDRFHDSVLLTITARCATAVRCCHSPPQHPSSMLLSHLDVCPSVFPACVVPRAGVPPFFCRLLSATRAQPAVACHMHQRTPCTPMEPCPTSSAPPGCLLLTTCSLVCAPSHLHDPPSLPAPRAVPPRRCGEPRLFMFSSYPLAVNHAPDGCMPLLLPRLLRACMHACWLHDADPRAESRVTPSFSATPQCFP